MKKILVATGGGDCPGLNAVIRGIVKAAKGVKGWEVWGSIEAFNGLLSDPVNIVKLTTKKTAGIHVKGGTIIKTTNRGNPLSYISTDEAGNTVSLDRSEELVKKVKDLGFHGLINIGGGR